MILIFECYDLDLLAMILIFYGMILIFSSMILIFYGMILIFDLDHFQSDLLQPCLAEPFLFQVDDTDAKLLMDFMVTSLHFIDRGHTALRVTTSQNI